MLPGGKDGTPGHCWVLIKMSKTKGCHLYLARQMAATEHPQLSPQLPREASQLVDDCHNQKGSAARNKS